MVQCELAACSLRILDWEPTGQAPLHAPAGGRTQPLSPVRPCCQPCPLYLELCTLINDISLQDAHNVLRPEALESLFVLWRVTRRRRYREQVGRSSLPTTGSQQEASSDGRLGAVQTWQMHSR